MKKIIVFLCAAFALLCVSFNASAQFSAPILRHGTDFVDQSGHELTDSEIIDLVGADIYGETVVGARKQLRAGNGLIIGGSIATGVGLVGACVAAYLAGDTISDAQANGQKAHITRETALFACSSLLAGAGALALSGGLAFHFVGKSRLNWVEGECNDAISQVRLDFGPTATGAGLVLRF